MTGSRAAATLLVFTLLVPVLAPMIPLAQASQPDPSPGLGMWPAEWVWDADGDGVDDRLRTMQGSLQVLVGLDAPVSSPDLARLAAAGLDLRDRFEIIDAVAGVIPSASLDLLASLPGVVRIEWDEPLVRFGDVSSRAIRARDSMDGVRVTGAPLDANYVGAWAGNPHLGFTGITGRGVTIGIMDEGIDMAHVSVDDLDDDATTLDPKVTIHISAADATLRNLVGEDMADFRGGYVHATMMAGVAAGTGDLDVLSVGERGAVHDSGAVSYFDRWARLGVAPGANLADIRVFMTLENPLGLLLTSQAIRGTDLTRSYNAANPDDPIHIAVASFGTCSFSDGNDAQSQAFNRLVDSGVVVLVASGNLGSGLCASTHTGSPGAAGKVITVGAVNDRRTITRDDDILASFTLSSHPSLTNANKPEVVAPGVSIAMPYAKGRNVYASASGTSFSAPIVAGVAALVLEANPDLTPAEVKSVIVRASEARGGSDPLAYADANLDNRDDVPSTGWVTGWGYGYVDAKAAVDLALSMRQQLSVGAGGPYAGSVDVPVTFTASASGGTAPYAFSWDMGDGTILAGAVVNHAFATAGTRSVTVTATDAEDRVGSASTTATIAGDGAPAVVITNPSDGATVSGTVVVSGITGTSGGDPNNAPIASFTHEASGLTLSVDGTASSDPDGDALSFAWSFGDGATQAGSPVTTHAYAAAGTYSVCLTVSDGQLDDTTCETVTLGAQAGTTLLFTDPAGDAPSPVPGSGNMDALDILETSISVDVDGFLTFTMTVADLTDLEVPVGDSGVGALWRTEWTHGGATSFVGMAIIETGEVRFQYGSRGATYSTEGLTDGSYTQTAPGFIHVKIPTSKMPAPGGLMQNILTTTTIYRGSPQSLPVSGGGLTTIDSAGGQAEYSAPSNAGLPAFRVHDVVPVWSGVSRAAPTEVPAFTQILDPAGDATITGGVGTSQFDITHGWFEADADNLYVGLKVVDIPADATTTMQIAYHVNFRPEWEVADPKWGYGEGREFTHLRVQAIRSVIAGTAVSDQETHYYLESMGTDGTRGFFLRLATITGSVSSDSDIVWWEVPRDLLQDVPPGGVLTMTSADTNVAIEGQVTFGGTATGDITDQGDDYALPGSSMNEPPVALLDLDVSEGAAPLTVTFTIEASDADGSVAGWVLDFGDGESTTGTAAAATRTHTYTAAGTFTATLTVTDDEGATGVASRAIAVSGGGSGGGDVVEVRVDTGPWKPAQTTDDWQTWTFNLDTTTLADGEHVLSARYTRGGVASNVDSISIVVANEGGSGDGAGVAITSPQDGSRVSPKTVTFEGVTTRGANAAPAAHLLADKSGGTPPLEVTFTVDGSDSDGVIASWGLGFGDGGASASGSSVPATATHTYTSEGVYTATLVVTDDRGATGTTTVTIHVSDSPLAVSAGGPYSGFVGNLVHLHAVPSGGSPPYTYAWSYGDGDVGMGEVSPHAYAAAGTYTATVTVTDGQGATASDSASVIVVEPTVDPDAIVVVAYIDTGINAYHNQFRESLALNPNVNAHPSTYIPGYPANVPALHLDGLNASTYSAARAADLAKWTDPANFANKKMHWIPGTKIVGVVSMHASNGWDNDGTPVLDSHGHGTAVASLIAGNVHGVDPRIRLVAIDPGINADVQSAITWAASQDWIDVLSLSLGYSICAGTLPGIVGLPGLATGCIPVGPPLVSYQQQAKAAAAKGMIVVNAAGNGFSNTGLLPDGLPGFHDGSSGASWVVSVGSAGARNDRPTLWHEWPTDIVSYGQDIRGAAPTSLSADAGFGGTSGATPIVAGAFGRVLLEVRKAIEDTRTPAERGSGRIAIASPANAPADGPLANGILTRPELEEAVMKTARPLAIEDGGYLGPIDPFAVPNHPWSFMRSGYGLVNRESADRAIDVILGASGMPNRYLPEEWKRAVDVLRNAVHGSPPAEPDDGDAYPSRSTPPSGEAGLFGSPGSVDFVTSLPRPQDLRIGDPRLHSVPQGTQPSPAANRLYLHHQASTQCRATGATYAGYMNTIADPGEPHDCSGIGGTGVTVGEVTHEFPMLHPGLEAGFTLDTEKDVVARVKVVTFADAGFASFPVIPSHEMRATLYAGSVAIGSGSDVQHLGAVDGGTVYDIRFKPTSATIAPTDDLRLVLSSTWSGARSMHFVTRGESWLDLPIATEGTPPLEEGAPVTYYARNFANGFTTNGATIAMSLEPPTGEPDKNSAYTFPQVGGTVVTMIADGALPENVLLHPELGAVTRVYIGANGGAVAKDYTVRAQLMTESGKLVASGSRTQDLILPGGAVPVDIPMPYVLSSLAAGEVLVLRVTYSGPGDILLATHTLRGGGEANPIYVRLRTAVESDGGTDPVDPGFNAEITTPGDGATVSGVIDVGGTAVYPEPATSSTTATYYARDVEEAMAGYGLLVTYRETWMSAEPPGADEPDADYAYLDPKIGGITLRSIHESPLADDLQLAPGAQAVGHFWIGALPFYDLGASPRVKVTVSAGTVTNPTLLGSASETRDIVSILGGPVEFAVPFALATSTVPAGETLTYTVNVQNVDGAYLAHTAFPVGSAEHPMKLVLPVVESAEAERFVDLRVGDTSPVRLPGGASWSTSVDTSSLADGETTLAARAVQTDSSGTSTSAWHTIQVTVQNDGDDAPPTASLSASPGAGYAPLDVTLSLDGSDDEGIMGWSLDFGDGSPAATGVALPATIHHTYATAGNYVARLTVTDTAEQTGIATATIDVLTAPVVRLRVEGPGLVGTWRDATDTSNAGDWSTWSAAHDFTDAASGVYTVTARWLHNGEDHVEHAIEIVVAPPGEAVARFTSHAEGARVKGLVTLGGTASMEDATASGTSAAAFATPTPPVIPTDPYGAAVAALRAGGHHVEPLARYDSSAGSLRAAITDLALATGQPLTPVTLDLLDDVLPTFDSELDAALAHVIRAAAEATRLRQAAFRDVDVDSLRASGLEPTARSALADKVDMAKLVHATNIMTRASLDVADVLRAHAAASPAAGTRSPPLIDIPSLLAIDPDGTDTTYAANYYYVTIDVGGDDTYLSNAGGSLGEIALTLDVAGNDLYHYTAPVDDRWTAAQGAGDFGVGVLIDLGGDDTYVADIPILEQGDYGDMDRLVHGAALFGVGLLLDVGGDDRYEANAGPAPATATYNEAVQGATVGGLPGVGVLLDLAGDDEYVANVVTSNAQGRTRTIWGEAGVLIDLGGRDVYSEERWQNSFLGQAEETGISGGFFLDVDVAAPTVLILEPTADSTAGDVLRVRADASTFLHAYRDPSGDLPGDAAPASTIAQVEIMLESDSAPRVVFTDFDPRSRIFEADLDLSDADGDRVLVVRATDAAGRIGEHAIPIRVDVNAPPIAAFTPPSGLESGSAALFTADSTDPDGSVVANRWTFGDGSPTKTGSAVTHTYAAHGELEVTLEAEDDGGKRASVTQVILVADGLPPVIGDVLTSDATATSVRLSWSTNEPASGLLHHGSTPAYGSTASVDSTGDGLSHTVVLEGLTFGSSYHYKVVATDDAGNAAERTGTFNTGDLGNTAPTAPTLDAPARASPGSIVSIVASATDPDPGDRVILRLDWGDGTVHESGELESGVTHTFTHTYAGSAQRVLTATARDRFNGVSPVTSQGLLVNSAPTLTDAAATPEVAKENEPTTFAVTYTDADGNEPEHVTLLLGGVAIPMTPGAGDVATGRTYSHEAVLAGGAHTYAFEAGDGIEDASTPESTAHANHAPVLSVGTVTPDRGDRATTFAFSVYYRDADGEAPVDARVIVSGTPYALAPLEATNDWAQGGLLVAEVTNLPIGDHEHRYVAGDGVETTSHPRDGTLSGPLVEQVTRIVLTYGGSDHEATCDDARCTTWTHDVDTRNLPEGDLVIVATAYEEDRAGPSTTRTLAVDNVPTADFTWTGTPTILEPTAFTDLSHDFEGSIVAWSWDFDGQGASALQSPSFQFPSKGDHAVTLTVTDDDGLTSSKTRLVTVANLPPGADFTWAPTPAGTEDVLTFTSTATDPDGTVVAWSWDFTNDGVDDATGATATWRFARSGTYTVRLTVTDDDGATGTAFLGVTILNARPLGVLAASPLDVSTYSDVVFDASGSHDPDGSIVLYEFTFGDGVVLTTPDAIVTHQYADGTITYDATVRVTDDEGATSFPSDPVAVLVQNRAPTPDFSVTYGAADRRIVHFADESHDLDGDVVAWSWSFGDGSTSTDADPIHAYDERDTYVVTLTVTDDDGASASLTRTIKVPNTPPTAALVVAPASPMSLTQATFDGSGSGDLDGDVVAYRFNFGDGVDTGWVTTPVVSHAYATGGRSFNATLTVRDNDGATSPAVQVVVDVGNRAPSAAFAATPVPATRLTPVQFSDLSTDSDGSIIQWHWRFGDGVTSRQKNPMHRYGTLGDHVVELTVTDNGGATSTITHTVRVDNILPVAAFSYAPTSGITILTDVAFTDASTDADGSIASRTWDLGDGATRTGSSFTYRYSAPGTYLVVLTVTDNDGGVSTKALTLTVNNIPPTAAGVLTPLYSRGTVAYENRSTDIDGHIAAVHWAFGDGETSTQSSGTHTFAEDGFYVVVLTVTDNHGANGVRTFETYADRAPPVTGTAVTGPLVEGNVYGGSARVTFTATDNLTGVATTWYRLNGGTPQRAPSTGLLLNSDGVHNVTYWSVDRAGNVETARFRIVTVDASPPIVAITNPVAAPGTNTAVVSGIVNVTATATDAVSGVALVRFFVDGVLVKEQTTGPYYYEWDARTLFPREHLLRVAAIDRAGNEASVTRTVYAASSLA